MNKLFEGSEHLQEGSLPRGKIMALIARHKTTSGIKFEFRGDLSSGAIWHAIQG